MKKLFYFSLTNNIVTIYGITMVKKEEKQIILLTAV